MMQKDCCKLRGSLGYQMRMSEGREGGLEGRRILKLSMDNGL